MYTNVRVNDVVADYPEYIQRAKELGHNAVFSTEHGNSGNILRLYDLCKQNGLKCIHGYESYFVFDRHEKTKRNWHICIISLNRNGMRANNRINSQANIDGFYYQPRVDMELLMTLPAEDVVVTTACINNCLMFPDDAHNPEKDFLLPMKEHFGRNFFLEIQDHDDDKQIALNKKIKEYSKRYEIPIIHGCDSHYIKPSDSARRMTFLKGKGYDYNLEDNFILDYPDEETIFKRYARQGVFTPDEIREALNATLVFDKAEDLGFTKEVKMPTIYPELSLEERVTLLKKHINEAWKKYIKAHPPVSKELKQKMLDGIRKEMKVIEETNPEIHIADYFLLNEEIIKTGIEKYHGTITRTGRGSAPSYFINTLLGFSTINRFTAPIKLYPSRFISTARLLETRSLPDIDFNVAEDTPFIKASEDILGEGHCYRMVAYITEKELAAFKNVCRSHGIDFAEANRIAKNIDKYRNDPKWGKLIEEAGSYVGVIDSVSPSPCSFLLLNYDIREEIGLIRVGGEICANIEKNIADEWKYLKNDILNVTVWKLVSETFKLIGEDIPPYEELVKKCDDRVWNLFGSGITASINQCSTANSKRIITQYKPKNIGELALYVAMIRPGAASLLDGFKNREPYTTGLEQFDSLLDSSSHYMAYQESIMAVLNYLGIPEDQTYSIIKKISKKKFKADELAELKAKLIKTFKEKIGTEEGFAEIWQVIEDAASYSFNSSHALCVATDALYGMYLKANYPLEYFTVCLNEYSDDLDMTSDLTNELKEFGIKLQSPKFRYADGQYSFERESRTITKGVCSVKNISQADADVLVAIKDKHFDYFGDLLSELKKLHINKKKIDVLILIDFFSEFGKNIKLKKFHDVYNEWSTKKNIKKTNIPDWLNVNWLNENNSIDKEKMIVITDMDDLMRKYFDFLPDEKLRVSEQIKTNLNLIGVPGVTIKTKYPAYYVQELDDTYTPKVTLYSLNDGQYIKAKIQKRKFANNPFKQGAFLYISGFVEKPRWIKTEDGFEQSTTETEKHIASYTVKMVKR